MNNFLNQVSKEIKLQIKCIRVESVTKYLRGTRLFKVGGGLRNLFPQENKLFHFFLLDKYI